MLRVHAFLLLLLKLDVQLLSHAALELQLLYVLLELIRFGVGLVHLLLSLLEKVLARSQLLPCSLQLCEELALLSVDQLDFVSLECRVFPQPF